MTVKVLHGDTLARLRQLPADHFHCCVTSPPYYGLRSYLPAGHPDKALEIGTEATPDDYVARLVEVFREVRRVLRPDGTLWLNLGDSFANDGKWGGSSSGKHVKALHGASGIGRERKNTGLKPKDLIGIPWMVAFALRADGWWLRRDIIWAKPNPMPESTIDRCTSSHEYVFHLTKSARYFYDAEAIAEKGSPDSHGGAPIEGGPKQRAIGQQAGGRMGVPAGDDPRNKRSVWTIGSQPCAEAHFATMPPELAETCILAGTSAHGCCAICGAPWARVVERVASVSERHPDGHGAHCPPSHHPGQTPHRVGNFRPKSSERGWQPTCTCPPASLARCTVLDPFGGSGTTGIVADRLRRDAVLIELHPDYLRIIEDRMHKDAGMFGDTRFEMAT